MTKKAPNIDPMDGVFKAMSDPTRRRLLDRLRVKDGQTLSELEKGETEEGSDMTRFGIMKHLKVLEDASLVVTRRSGRFKHHYLNVVPMQEVLDRWIEPMTQKPLARLTLDLKAQLEGTIDMAATDEKPDFVLETFIRAPIDTVWEALTDPEVFSKYHFFSASLRGDWVKGGKIDNVLPDGNTMLSHEITDIQPKTRIEMSFEPHWSPGLAPSRMAYELEQLEGACRLSILHWGIPEGQEGVARGWSEFAASLKSYLETGEPLIIPNEMGSEA